MGKRPWTVGDLIARLQKCDPDALMVCGWSGAIPVAFVEEAEAIAPETGGAVAVVWLKPEPFESFADGSVGMLNEVD